MYQDRRLVGGKQEYEYLEEERANSRDSTGVNFISGQWLDFSFKVLYN